MAARSAIARSLAGANLVPSTGSPDFLTCTVAATEGARISGVYNLGDEAPFTFQEFIDTLVEYWGYLKPPLA